MYRRLTLACVLTGLSACSGQSARDADQPVTIGAGISTMGIVVEPSVQTGPKTAVRIPLAFGNANFSQTVDGIDYDVTGRVGGIGVLADYYPAAGALRLSGGLFRSSLNADGRATGTVEVGGTTYGGVDIRTNGRPSQRIAPMVSVGYDGHLASGWGISTDIGVMYTGGFEVSIDDVTGTASQADLDAEVNAVNDELSDYKVLPFIKLGATYRW